MYDFKHWPVINLRWKTLAVLLITLGMVAVLPVQSHGAVLSKDNLNVQGWVRGMTSVNTQDPWVMERGFPFADDGVDDRWEFNMLRWTFYGDAKLDLENKGLGSWRMIFWSNKESMTSYLDRLNDRIAFHQSNTIGGAGFRGLRDVYDNTEIREAYWDINLTSDISMRLGKQQVVWGKTDFFQAMDLVQGFDNSYRFFLEDPQFRRKPTTMANIKINAPEYGGTLQLLWRPGVGWTEIEDIGNTPPFTGRWRFQPFRGLNLFAPGNVPLTDSHPESNSDNDMYGVRWNGTYGLWEYSLAYLHTNQNETMLNSGLDPYKRVPPNAGGTPTFADAIGGAENIHPEIDILGATANYFYAPLDVIVSGEAAYQFDRVHNYGDNPTNPPSDCNVGLVPSNAAPPVGQSSLPFGGACGVKQKDTLKMSLRLDKTQFYPAKTWLGSSRPGFLSLQVFDEWIVNHEEDDQIVDFYGFFEEQDEHSVIATALLNWHYMHDRFNPSFVVGTDLSYGGGFLLPSVEYVYGNNWRVTLEGFFAWEEGSTKTFFQSPTPSKNAGHFFSLLDGTNQITLSVKYQWSLN